TPPEIGFAAMAREQMVCDVELFPNYFLVSFCSVETGAIWYCEAEGSGASLSPDAREMLNYILNNFEIITFNGINYDIPIVTIALQGASIEELYHASGA